MTGLRGVRQEIKAIREELGGSRRYERFIVMQAGADVDEAVVDAFLDRELGQARDRCVVVNLQQFCDEPAEPTILSDVPYRGALMTSLRRVRDRVREMRAELAPGQPQRLIAVSTANEAYEVQGRLGPGEDALIVITGVPRGDSVEPG